MPKIKIINLKEILIGQCTCHRIMTPWFLISFTFTMQFCLSSQWNLWAKQRLHSTISRRDKCCSSQCQGLLCSRQEGGPNCRTRTRKRMAALLLGKTLHQINSCKTNNLNMETINTAKQEAKRQHNNCKRKTQDLNTSRTTRGWWTGGNTAWGKSDLTR